MARKKSKKRSSSSTGRRRTSRGLSAREMQRQPAYAQFMEHYGAATQERLRGGFHLSSQLIRTEPSGRSRHTLRESAGEMDATMEQATRAMQNLREAWNRGSPPPMVRLMSGRGLIGSAVMGVNVWQQPVQKVDIGTLRGIGRVRAMAIAKTAEQIFVARLALELRMGFRFQWDYQVLHNTYHLIIHRMSDKEIVFENSYTQDWIGNYASPETLAASVAEGAIHYIVGARREMALARKEFWSLYDGNGDVIKTWHQRPSEEGVIEAITVGDTAPFAVVRGTRTDVYDIGDSGDAIRLGALSDALPGETPTAPPKRLVQIRE